MKKLQIDKSSSEAIQSMELANQELVSGAESIFVSEGEWVELTAWEDSSWVSDISPVVPADKYSGHAMPEGKSAPYFIRKGHKIAVFGKISISW